MAAIQCPRCSKPCTTRFRSLTRGLAGGSGAGLAYVLMLPFALQRTYCPDHGKIPLDEFSAEHRGRIKRRSAIQLAVTLALITVAIAIVVVVLRGLATT